MFIYNTLTRKKETFRPLKRKTVGLYTCGPTVYNYAHIGNLRTYIFEDILERAFIYNGYKVNRAMNITDVGHLTSDADSGEDKLQKEAKKEGRSVWEIAEFYTKAFFDDLKLLNIRIPKKIGAATKFIPEQIKIIKRLFKNGYAYETSRAVYFDVHKFKNYAKLSRQNINGLSIGARDEVVEDAEKHNPADFALWFKLVGQFKNHVMRWDSPWGKGFPGWHIECSAISSSLLGQPFDIHTGGIDHISIHHTNEIAQSEGAYKKPLAKYWMHGEFLVLKNERMGKSLDNFITLSNVIEKGYEPMHYRYFTLMAHYRSPLTFTWEALDGARVGYEKLKNNIISLFQDQPTLPATDFSQKPIEEFSKKFKVAVNDDLNVPAALGEFHIFLKLCNTLLENKEIGTSFLKKAARMVQEADNVLGLMLFEKTPKIPASIMKFVEEREIYRGNKQFTQADVLRKKLDALGYVVEDTGERVRVRKK